MARARNSTAYVDIPTDVDEDVEPDSLPDEGNIEIQEHGRSMNDLDATYEQSLRCCSPASIFSLGFAIGAIAMLATQTLYSYHVGDSSRHQNVNTSNMNQFSSDISFAHQGTNIDSVHQADEDFIESEENEKDAVSYNFLRTSKGSSTISTLLKDLIHPKPKGGDIKSSIEDAGYESLGGPRRALTHLVELMKDDGQIHSSCHPLAHNLGRVAYEYFGSFDAAFDSMIGTDDAKLLRVCNAAYLHGVIEFHLRNVHDMNDLATVAAEINDNVCSRLNNVNLGGWECRHGVGHGIMQRFRMDSAKTVLQLAIDGCAEAFPHSGKDECENGLWMDHFATSGNIIGMETQMMAMDIIEAEYKNAMNAVTNTEAIEEKPQNEVESNHQLPTVPDVSSLRLCDEFAKYARLDCYLYMATEYLLIHPGDYLGALSFCQDSTAHISKETIRGCVSSVGMQCAKEHMDNFIAVENVCKTLDQEFASVCFAQAVSYYSTSSGGIRPKDAGVCDELVTFKQMC